MRIIKEFLWKLPHKLAHSIIYFHKTKRCMNWKNPITYDEKLHWLMVHVLTSEYGRAWKILNLESFRIQI